MKKIELLAPAGSMASLKAAVSKGADAVYLGMERFSARGYARNFNDKFLSEAVSICKPRGIQIYLAMNTLVKNDEIDSFFDQLSFAYSKGIDAVIIQEISFLGVIRQNYPDLKVHISTQAGVLNSRHANLFSKSDRITLAREITEDEIRYIRNNFSKELEIFCHGALCASFSGSCLFSSFLGGRSGNRGRCAQPCRKKYNGCYYLSTKELCLIDKIPSMIELKIDAVKIEGRMRTPGYVAAATDSYRKAIDLYYSDGSTVPKEILNNLHNAFSREFTEGVFSRQDNIFNRDDSKGIVSNNRREFYNVEPSSYRQERKAPKVRLSFEPKQNKESMLLVRAYNKKDAILAEKSGADIIYFDIFDKQFWDLKEILNCRLFGVVPRLLLDQDIDKINSMLNNGKPDGILSGNLGLCKLGIPVHLDFNLNCFNDNDINYFTNKGCIPIVSPELSLGELKKLNNKNFIVFVHGKIRLMTFRHNLCDGELIDEKGARFLVNPVRNGSELLNYKELGMLSKSCSLFKCGITKFFVDTDKDVGEIVSFYRSVLDGNKVDDSKLMKKYVLGWSYKGVI
ncbi:MAG: U32 family peptidase [Nanoarchaeota archaeon]